MDQTNHQKLSRFTKLLLSISVFSLLSWSSNFLSFLPPWHFHLSPFPLRLVTPAVSKNCIFLLCNGILVFLAQDSGFIGTKTRSRHSTTNKDPPKETLYVMENKLLDMDIYDGVFPDVMQEDFALGEEAKTLNNNNNNHEDCAVEVEIGNVCFHTEGCARYNDDDNKEEEQEDKIGFSTLEARNVVAISDPDDDEELDECGGEREDATIEDYKNGMEIRYGDNVMTVEELDKKFDDFIRRMKEGIMIETQQHQQQLLWSSV
ncbi:uncharacterized protein LOC115689360 [Syzygium oleosum]|uniref:uncharacterized protein LOC115689360 n=1 Tax=Syzygium oleosum TaxID=219896 RepID=UPI0011D2BDA0|nr:uncharacterized protein LOC115689360 [Syzygium oleosum]